MYQIAENKSNKLIASVGELRSSYNLNRYEETIKSAEKLIENDRANSEQKREAYYKMAKSYYALEQNIRASPEYDHLY